MPALTTAYEAKKTLGGQKAYRMAVSTTIYKGALVAVNAAGFAVPAADTAATFVVGVAYETRTNTGGSGATSVLVEKSGEYEYSTTGATQANVGKTMVVVDDNTVALTSTNSIPVGKCTEVLSSTRVRIRIDGVIS